MEENQNIQDNSLTLSGLSRQYLETISRWSKLFAILGFIGSLLMLVLGLFINTIISKFSSLPEGTIPQFLMPVVGVLYGGIGVLHFFPSLYLFKFSEKMKEALATNQNDILESSFKNLKSCFKFWGVFTVIILSIYILFFLFALVF